MTTEQAALHQELFGAVDLEVSAPALVRDGHLAPYQELAWFTTPTPAEADYIGGQALRFAELRAGLLDPGFASTPFLAWLQQRVVERRAAGTGAQLSWEHFARDQPALADAALRLHYDGMLPLPDGATVREQHRVPPVVNRRRGWPPPPTATPGSSPSAAARAGNHAATCPWSPGSSPRAVRVPWWGRGRCWARDGTPRPST
jgi:hypothetical protein